MLEDDSFIYEDILIEEDQIEEIPISDDYNIIYDDSDILVEDPINQSNGDGILFDDEIRNISSDEIVDNEQSNNDDIVALIEEHNQNVITGFNNMMIIGSVNVGVTCALFGGFVIYCFLNRLG